MKTGEGDSTKTVFRSEKVERRLNRLEDRRRLDLIETLYSQESRMVEEELASKHKSFKSPNKKISEIDEPEELWALLEYSSDPTGMEVSELVIQLGQIIEKIE